MSEQNHTPAKIQQRDKGKLKEEKDNTATSKRMNSKSTVDDHTNAQIYKSLNTAFASEA